MAQQTSVEWLFDNLKSHFEHDGDLLEVIQMSFNIAKEMEIEQIVECWNVAHQAGRFEGKGIAEENWQTFEQYYNETYGK